MGRLEGSLPCVKKDVKRCLRNPLVKPARQSLSHIDYRDFAGTKPSNHRASRNPELLCVFASVMQAKTHCQCIIIHSI